MAPVLQLDHLSKVYRNGRGARNITFSVEPGQVVGLLGPNGSGKTTWMKMAAGLIKPTSGQMYYKDRPLDVDSRREIAYMSTEPYFYTWMTAGDVGKYYRDFFEDFSMEKYLSLLERMELTVDLKTRSLSSGMMAKLKIAVTLARDARVIMLDEPLNGIDLLARDEIMKCIVDAADEDRILLVSSHLVEELETVADYAVFIRKGKLVDMRELEELRISEGISVADKYRQIYAADGGENA